MSRKHVWGTDKDLNWTGPISNSDTPDSSQQKVLSKASSYLIPEYLEVRQIAPYGFSWENLMG